MCVCLDCYLLLWAIAIKGAFVYHIHDHIIFFYIIVITKSLGVTTAWVDSRVETENGLGWSVRIAICWLIVV